MLAESVPGLNKDKIVETMDELMELVALEEVKIQFLNILTQIEICAQQQADIKEQRFHAVFQGNPGTGKYNLPLIQTDVDVEASSLLTSCYIFFR